MEVTNKGRVCLTQIHGHTQLYGSKTTHDYYIGLEICSSTGGESMNPSDKSYPERGSLISIELSMLQFAEMISSIGKGEGTPCTIRRFDGKALPKYELPNQRKTLVDYAKSIDERSNEEIRTVRNSLRQKMAEGKRPTKAEMQEMVDLLDRADCDRMNLSFIAEETEKIFEAAVGDAKQQIEAHAMIALGTTANVPRLIAPDVPRLSSAIFCEHANEMPAVCPCPDDCYCKENSCKSMGN